MINKTIEKTAERFRKELESGLGVDVSVSYTDEALYLYIYGSNGVDYKKVCLRWCEELLTINITKYVEFVLADPKNYTQHVATPEEVYISSLLKQYACKELWILDGVLMIRGDEPVCFADIESLNFDKSTKTLVVTGRYDIVTVDLENEDWSYIDREIVI